MCFMSSPFEADGASEASLPRGSHFEYLEILVWGEGAKQMIQLRLQTYTTGMQIETILT